MKKIRLPALCYLAAVILWLAAALWNFGSDTLARAQGRLAVQEIAVTDFHLVDLAVVEAGEASVTLQTTSGDPQMILEDMSGQVVRTLSYRADFSQSEPREMCLYYTTAYGEAYSADKRVYPEVTADGSYLYTLPRGSVVSLRLDPCSPEENKTVGLTFAPASVTLNAQTPGLIGYLIPGWYQIFCLVLYPALAAAALDWLRSARRRS